jgi:mRNA interferase HigB
MRIIAKRTLRMFWEAKPQHHPARSPLEDWHARARAADWSTPADLKADFGDASVLKDGRVVFNIGWNRFRLVARINYHHRILYVRFVGTHEEYDRIDAQTV